MDDDGLASFPSSSSPLLTNLSLSLKEHKIQTADELVHLHASHISTQLSLTSHISKINSKLEALNTHISEKEGKQSVELVKMHESVTALAQQLSIMLTPAGDHSTIRGFSACAHLWRDRRMEMCCFLRHD